MSGTPIPPAVGDCHALVYTPDVAATPNRLASDLRGLAFSFNRLVGDARDPADDRPVWPDATAVDLLIVDEADRLKMAGLEQVRDFYDRANFAAGRADREIADTLFLSLRTVENYVARLTAKLGVHSRHEAVAVARAAGVLFASDAPPAEAGEVRACT